MAFSGSQYLSERYRKEDVKCFSQDVKCYFQEQMLRTRGSAESSSSASQITSDRSAPQVFHRSICCEGLSEGQGPRQKPFLPKSLERLAGILLPWCDPALRPDGLRLLFSAKKSWIS